MYRKIQICFAFESSSFKCYTAYMAKKKQSSILIERAKAGVLEDVKPRTVKTTPDGFKKGCAPGPAARKRETPKKHGQPKKLSGVIAAREILNEHMPSLIHHAINMALDGDSAVMRELLKLGIPKLNAAVNINVDARHVDSQVAQLFNDMRDGVISVGEAVEATKMLKNIHEIKEAKEMHNEMINKLEAIEKTIGED